MASGRVWPKAHVELLKKYLREGELGYNAICEKLNKKFGTHYTFSAIDCKVRSLVEEDPEWSYLKGGRYTSTRTRLARLGVDLYKEVSALALQGFSPLMIADKINEKIGERIVSVDTVRGICLRQGISVKASAQKATKFFDDPKQAAQFLIESQKAVAAEKAKDRLVRELSQKRALMEIFSEAIQGAVYNLPPIDTSVLIAKTDASKKKIRFDDETFVLLLGDLHYGELTRAEETGGLIEFNSHIFEKSIGVLFDRICTIKEIHSKAYKLPKLTIMMLGDIVSNDFLFPGQPFQVDQNVTDQIFGCARILQEFILKLLTVFPEIEINCVAGNHGRVSGKPGERPFTVNWDFILYRFLESSFIAEKRVKFNVSTTWYMQVDIKGWTFTITHGEDIKSYLSMPYYSLEKAEMKYDKMLPKKTNYFCVGHFHKWACIDSGRDTQIIVNGALPGGSIFSAKKLMSISQPCQLIFGVNRRHGKTWLYDIHL